MPRTSLTSAFVETVVCPPTCKRMDYYDADCKGLTLDVRRTGGKTWYFHYNDKRGRRRYFMIASCDDISLAQARKQADELRIKTAMGQDPCEQRRVKRDMPRFETFVRDHYLPYTRAYKSSWHVDDGYLRLHLLPKIGQHYLDAITKREIITLHLGMREKNYAPATCNRVLMLLRHIYNRAMDWEIGGLTANPTKGIKLFQEDNFRERFLTSEEAGTLLACVENSPNPQLKFIVPMLMLSGARKREVLDSKWEDFDVARQQWRIPKTKSGKHRHVPISDGFVRVLRAIPRRPDNPYVVPDPKTDKPFISIQYFWQRARKDAGLADVRMHDLRHSFASFLVNSGRSIYEVQKILGHSQIRTTQRYAHLSQETLLQAANSAGAAIGYTGPRAEISAGTTIGARSIECEEFAKPTTVEDSVVACTPVDT